MKNADICVTYTPYNSLARLEPVPSKVLVSPFTLTVHIMESQHSKPWQEKE
jgi:hypothetical protein